MTLTIAAVGDIMLGTDYPKDLLPPESEPGLLQAMAPVLKKADITFGNLEGVLMDGGEAKKQCLNPEHCYLFRTPSRFVEQLQQAGFDVLSLANNHARDFGEAGRSHTMRVLDQAGIRHSGRMDDVASWEVKGRRVALVAFAPFANAHDLLTLKTAQATVMALAERHDIVLVSMHAGAEGIEAMHVPFGPEFFHGEARGDVVAFARAMIDVGADLVIGHGPHVPRALEIYKGRLVAYSLGNFSTYWGISVEEEKGLAPVLMVDLNADGAFVEGHIISAYQQRPNGPQLDPNNTVAQLMAELTRNDFAHTSLHIDEAGRIQHRAQVQATPSPTKLSGELITEGRLTQP